MDTLNLPTISQEFFDRVSELVDTAKDCRSLKDAQPYIQRIQFLSSETSGRCSYKLADITSILNDYCKKNADKYVVGMHLANAMSVLESFVKEQTSL